MSDIVKKEPVSSKIQSSAFLNELAKVTPRTVGLTPERCARIALTTFKQTPALQDCSQESILGSIMLCAQFGLDPGGPAGLAYLVPYGKTCTFIIGYKGLITLAIRSGQVKSIEAVTIRENDHYEIKRGTDPGIVHKPSLQGGKAIGVYAVATLHDGTKQFEVMTIDEVEQIKTRSRAGSGPWKTDYDEMARKTVTRRLCKYLNLTPEVQSALSIDEEAETGRDQSLPTIDIVGESKPKTRAAEIKEQMAATAPEPEPVDTPASNHSHWTKISDCEEAHAGDTFTVSGQFNRITPYAQHTRIDIKADGKLMTCKFIPPLSQKDVDVLSAAYGPQALTVSGRVTFEKNDRVFVGESYEPFGISG